MSLDQAALGSVPEIHRWVIHPGKTSHAVSWNSKCEMKCSGISVLK